MAIAAAVGAAILLVVAVPSITLAWSFVWNTWDELAGGPEDRNERLRDHPFPAALAPPGYRIVANGEPCDDWDAVEDCPSGWAVSFAGPDDEDTISFHPHRMIAEEVYDYWTRGNEIFGVESLPVENLGSHTHCGEQELFGLHRVMCVAAFDGMAVMSESANNRPERGSIEHAVTMLRAGVAHWESIRH